MNLRGMKDIVLIAHFVGGLKKTGNNRFPHLAKLFSEFGSVELITSDFDHGSKDKSAGDYDQFPFRITLLEEPGYSKNICLKRFYSHAAFGRQVANYLKKRKKPDVIYCAVPSLDAAQAAANYANQYNIRFIIDIQDLWPEAFQMVFHVPIISKLIFAPMKYQANLIYAQADEIVAVSNTYGKRAAKVNTKCNNYHTVFLGTQLENFDRNARNHAVTDKPEGELWLAYCGMLGSSYDLICVMDALEQLKNRGVTPPKFVVMGDGPRRKELEGYAKTKNVNAWFTGKLTYDKMCGLLCACDMTVNPIVPGAAQSIINKHADYAASGLPVLNTQECQEYRDLVEEYQMGINCVSGNAVDLANQMQWLMQHAALRLEMGNNARRCAEERFDRKYIYQSLIDTIFA